MPQREIVQAQVVGSTAPIAPTRESRLGRPTGAAAVRTPPARFTDRVARPAVVRGPGAGVARPATAPVRNDRPPAAQTPAARPAEQPRAVPQTEKKAVKKTEKKEEKKDIR